MHIRGVCFLVLTLGLVGCNTSAPNKPAMKPPEVLITQAIQEQIVDFEDFTGHTESRNMVEIKARVTGYLEKIHFKDGDIVKEGDLLFEIDPRPYQVEVQRAEAALSQAEVRFKRLDVDLLRANVLRQMKAISPEDYDKIKADRNDAEAAIGVSRADLAKAKLNLDYTRITVPMLDNGYKQLELVAGAAGMIGAGDPWGSAGMFAARYKPRLGQVGRRQKDPGNLIKADDTTLTTVVTHNPMYVYFDVDERTVLNLRALIQAKKIRSVKEMTFRFGLASDEGKFPYVGNIDFEDNKLDAGTGTLTLRGTFNNDKRLSPGLFVRLRLLVGVPRKAVMVPERALGTDQGQRFLYMVKTETDKDGKLVQKAEYRGGGDLQVGALYDGWRVIEKGISVGDTIIWSGLQRVRKDVPISTKQQDPPRPKLN